MDLIKCLPEHKTITLEHNGHTTRYTSLQNYIDYWNNDDPNWISESQKQLAYELDELWEVTWTDMEDKLHKVSGQSLQAICLHLTGHNPDPMRYSSQIGCLYIAHDNDVDAYYMPDQDEYLNDDEFRASLESRSYWQLQWYPAYTNSFKDIYADKIESILDYFTANHPDWL